MLKRQTFSDRKYDNFQHRLDSALFAYRNTPSSVTLKTPAELIFGYLPQTAITKVRSNHLLKEKKYQDYQKSYFNRNATKRHFEINERVWVKSTRGDVIKWFPGKITKVISQSTFLVKVNNKTRYVHSDHLRKSAIDEEKFSFSNLTNMNRDVNVPSIRNAILPALDIASKPNEENAQNNCANETLPNEEPSIVKPENPPNAESQKSPIRSTRPKRNVKPIQRYGIDS
ncbi:uncharacterized protein LOC129232106 [Uloborus diversus]|uniref:uncharacterized protein LOC129232106 n=1 Tax=Uloborus diversus TaxID=327109 RepID=UPI00240A9A7E|nr:uncharacterized protein LOC129232106 [Uloborus diversus]